MDTNDIIVIIAFLLFLGYIWTIPKEQIYDALVTVIVAAIGAGWLLTRKKKKQ